MAREQDFNPVPALFMCCSCNLFPLGAALSLQSVWARTITGMRAGRAGGQGAIRLVLRYSETLLEKMRPEGMIMDETECPVSLYATSFSCLLARERSKRNLALTYKQMHNVILYSAMINCRFTTLQDYLIDRYIFFFCEPFNFFN